MTENNEFCTNKFLQGVLSQSALNEKCSSGFASRNISDKLLFNEIIQSTSDIKPTHVIRHESVSKVDKIIEDFLHKVKKRGMDPKIKSVTVRDNKPDTQCCMFRDQKRTKWEHGPLRFFRTLSPEPREEIRLISNTRSHYNLKEERNNISHEDAAHNGFTIPTLSRFMKTSHRSNFPNIDYYNNSCVDLDETSANIYSENYQAHPPRLNNFIYKQLTCNESKSNFEPFVSSHDKIDQNYKFDCDFISPIQRSFSEDIKKVVPPNAFSTPKYRESNPHLLNLVQQNPFIMQKSVGTQTNCNHICLMCSSPEKKHSKKFDYFYEE